MCLYPILIKNKKYTANKKNKGKIPWTNDERVKWVPVGCGKCIECVNKKKREWQVRLSEEIRTNNTGKFITLTFSEESLTEIKKIIKNDNENTIAKYAVRHFLERWRKKHKKSLRHWLTTELGHNNTERLHLHGIIFTNENKRNIEQTWQYGWIHIGEYVNLKTINYIIKYTTKIDEKHKEYRPIILCSPGIGAGYENRKDSKTNKFNGNETIEEYRLPNGNKTSLPIYYRNKLYSEDEREKLWINKLDKQERWIRGQKIDVSSKKGIIEFENTQKYQRTINERLGYGKREKTEKWHKIIVNLSQNNLHI